MLQNLRKNLVFMSIIMVGMLISKQSFGQCSPDLTDPVITCPSNIVVNQDPSSCGASVSYSLPTATDNCPVAGTPITPIRMSGFGSGSTFPVGTTAITYRATDGDGNFKECSFSIQVNDIQAPAISNCPSNISLTIAPGFCSQVATWSSPSASDNCSVNTFTSNFSSGASFPVGSTVVNYTAADLAGNMALCSFTVTVVDNQEPVISNCPANASANTGIALCTQTVTWVAPSASDNCAVTSFTSNFSPGAAFLAGNNVVTYVAQDASGNSAQCSFTVTITDITNPTINCPSNISVDASVGICGSVISYSTPFGTDNCSGQVTTQTSGLASGATFPVGITVNTFKVTDVGSNTASCSFTVSVVDTQSPTITCPSTISKNTDAGLCSAVTNYTVNFNDNCPGATLNQTAGLPSGNAFPKGTTLNTYQVTDGAGLTASCSFSVVVTDAQNPTIACPSNISENAATGLCSAVVNYTPPAGSDNCSGETTTQTSGLASGATYSVGNTVNTFKVTDAAGNNTSCSFTVTVVDTQNPTITCPSNISVNASTGLCSSVVNYTPPIGSDNCSGQTTSQTAGLTSGATYPVGTTVNTFKVTDAAGNNASCSFTVSVVDTQNPTITCPSTISKNTDAGQCSAVTNFTVNFNDNCSGASLSQTAGLPDGSAFPKGTTLNTYKVTDAAGNNASCSFSVVVTDNETPTITCPSNISANATTGLCSSVVNYTPPVGSDNCSGQTTSQTAGLASGATYPLGTTVNTFKVTDAVGNNTSCSFTVTVVDTQSPTITCPSNISENATTGLCSSVVNYTPPVGSDNCSGQTTSQTAGLASGATYPVGTTVNTFKVTDAAGNNTACSFTVTVIDTQNPTISCPANISNSVVPGTCSGPVTYSTPVGSDNCSGQTTIQTSGLSSGSFFTVGTTINTFKVTDASGNTAQCTFLVTMIDNVPPTISNCPSNITLNNTPGQCTKDVTWTAPTASDICLMSSFVSSHDPGAVFPVGTTSVTYTATDVSGNTATCVFSVTIVDNQNPTLTCPSNISVSNNTGICGAVVNFTAPAGTDNCSVSTIQTAGFASGSTFPVGTTVQSFKATDASGNTATCSFNITVTDTQNPTITCPSNISENASTGLCSAVVNYTPPVGSDNCSGQNTTQTAGLTSGATYPVGNTVNTFKVTDAAGNNTSCSFTVTVVDTQNPTITCPSNISVNASTGLCSSVVNYTPPVGSDNCSGQTTSQTAGLTSGATYPVGTTVNTFKVTDAAGNNASCSFTVSVVDTQNPTITCPSTISKNTDAGQCSAVTNFTVNFNDNCSGASLSQTAGLPDGSAFPKGTTLNTYKVTDAAGNNASCSFSVVVTDNEKPTITCPTDMTVTNNPGNCSAFVTFSPAVGVDNCPGSTTSQISGLFSGSSFPVGVTTNLFEVVDAVGLTKQCLFTVTVRDATSPVITSCPSNISVNANLGVCTATAAWALPTATDNCSATTFTSNYTPGNSFTTGVNTVTYVASDNAGNTASCVFSVTVIDTQNPTITCPSNFSTTVRPGQCASSTITYNVFPADNCSGAFATQIAGLASGSSFPKGNTVNTFNVTDASGNIGTACSFTVIVTDNESPVFTCPSNIAVNNTTGQCTAKVDYTVAVNDNCPGVTFSLTAGLASGANFPKGITAVVYTALDASNNTSVCNFSVTVTDNELPVISGCPSNTTISTSFGQCSNIYSWTSPNVTDNCSGATINQTSGLASGSAFPKGTNVVTYTAADATLTNTVTCTFSITVLDNENPSISCPANITAANDPGFCTAVVTYSPLSATDNCSGTVISQTAGLASGSNFPAGTTVNTFIATDASGNTSTCSFNVTVSETELPLINCISSIVANNDLGQCGKVVTYVTPVGTDNCPGVNTTQLTGLASGSTFPIGQTVNTFKVTDASGNSATCSFSVTISDTENPTIICPSTISKNTDAGVCSAAVSYTVDFNDNCSGAVLSQTAGLSSGSVFPKGMTVNSYVVTDAKGNSSACTFTVNVVDNEVPTISLCQPNFTLNAAAGVCGNVGFWVTPTVTDNCSGSVNIVQTSGLPSGSTFPVGVSSIVYTATDASGNTSLCSFDITVIDRQKPSISCLSNITATTSTGFCSAQVSFSTLSAIDNCSGVVVSQALGLPSGSNFPAGTTINKFVATDASGNTDTCTFHVVVLESTPPVITCPSDLAGTTDAGVCGKAITYVAPVGTDNCAGATTSQTSGLASGSTFPTGVTVNTFKVTDASGNLATCSFSVTITDIELPIITCGSNITKGNDVGQCAGTVTFVVPVGVDNCSVTTVQTAGLASGSQFPSGLTVNTFKATDASGNTATCSFSVTITDTELPSLACGSNILVNSDAGQCTKTVTFTLPTVTDNCSGVGAVSQTAGLSSGSQFTVGLTVNTFTATDAAGNVGTCSFTVAVVPAGASVSYTSSSQGTTVTFSNTSTGSTSYSWDFGDGTTSTSANPVHSYTTTGTYTVCLTATNACTTTTVCGEITINANGINTYGNAASINVYPIPANDYVNLEIVDSENRSYTVQLFNTLGQSVYNTTFNVTSSAKSIEVINLRGMPVGVYMVQLISKDGHVKRNVSIMKN